MAILVINSGSSSVKYGVFDQFDGGERSRGTIDLSDSDHAGDRATAIGQIFEQAQSAHKIGSIGHRVVHGGAAFRRSMRIDVEVLERIRSLHHLAPLHNPACTLGIEIALETAPEIPQVAVFDTTFSSTLPESAWRYALPKAMADKHQIRRYGFHGISHQYVTTVAAHHLGRAPNTLRLITLHLGNGASAAAIEGGRCVETSMGMTPEEGLVMGTRAGDLDPSILIHLQRHTGMTADALEQLLNRESGLRGLCGESDMRIIRQRAHSGDANARLAIDIFAHRVRKYIGAYVAVLGGLDGLVFTGGIGEHDAELRAEVCMNLAYLGIRLDAQRNAGHATVISPEGESTRVMVVPTNEELAIAQETQRCLAN
jgi:acetate kinase